MSYTRANGTTLIARRSYSDLGATECGPGQTYRGDVTFANVKGQCMTDAQYAECKSKGMIYNQACTVSTGGDGVLGTIGGVLKGALSFFSQTQKTAGEAEAYRKMMESQTAQKAGGAPAWLLPVAIGGVGLVAVVLLTRRK